MPFSIRDELSPVVQQYAMYLRNVRGLSSKTVTEYCKDLRTFFRFVKRVPRPKVPPETPFEEIAVQDANLEFIRSVTTYEIYAFMNYVADDRNNMASTRQRKTTTLRSFFGYLTAHEKLLEKDPTRNLGGPQKGQVPPPFSFARTKYRTSQRGGGPQRRAGPVHFGAAAQTAACASPSWWLSTSPTCCATTTPCGFWARATRSALST